MYGKYPCQRLKPQVPSQPQSTSHYVTNFLDFPAQEVDGSMVIGSMGYNSPTDPKWGIFVGFFPHPTDPKITFDLIPADSSKHPNFQPTSKVLRATRVWW